MVFMNVIGQHFEDASLKDILVETGIYGDVISDRILAGKSWNQGVRAHKLTMESLSRIVLEQFYNWLDYRERLHFRT